MLYWESETCERKLVYSLGYLRYQDFPYGKLDSGHNTYISFYLKFILYI